MKKTIAIVFCAAALAAGAVRAQSPTEAWPGSYFAPDGSVESVWQDPAPGPSDTAEATIQEEIGRAHV